MSPFSMKDIPILANKLEQMQNEKSADKKLSTYDVIKELSPQIQSLRDEGFSYKSIYEVLKERLHITYNTFYNYVLQILRENDHE